MKVLENGKIQMDIGEKVNCAEHLYVVVRDAECSYCRNCPFYDSEKCKIFACSALSRDDGEMVHFEEVKK